MYFKTIGLTYHCLELHVVWESTLKLFIWIYLEFAWKYPNCAWNSFGSIKNVLRNLLRNIVPVLGNLKVQWNLHGYTHTVFGDPFGYIQEWECAKESTWKYQYSNCAWPVQNLLKNPNCVVITTFWSHCLHLGPMLCVS